MNRTLFSNICTLPNTISVLRCLSGPLALVLLLGFGQGFVVMTLLLLLLLASEASDFYDGYIARRRGQISPFGMLLDPLADALYRLLTFIAFLSMGWIPAWMLAVFVAREIIIIYLRTFFQQHNITLAARLTGKIKAVCQANALIGIVVIQLIERSVATWFVELYQVHGAVIHTVLNHLTLLILWVAVVATLWSGLDYIAHFFRTFFFQPSSSAKLS